MAAPATVPRGRVDVRRHGNGSTLRGSSGRVEEPPITIPIRVHAEPSDCRWAANRSFNGRPATVIIRTEQGEAITCSMSRQGNFYDNAVFESWLSTVTS